MNDAEFKLWAAKLPELTKTQLSALRSRLQLLSTPKLSEGKSDFGHRVVSVICEVLKSNGADIVSPAMLQRSPAYASAKGKIADLEEFFKKISQKKLVQDAILKEAVSLLYFDLLQWQKVPISPQLILGQINKIPSVLNRHFPGYAMSGVLTKLVDRG